MIISKLKYLILSIAVALLVSCSVNYTMTGGDTGDAKTVSIKTFQSYAPLANPNLSQTFTEALKDIFLAQTNLDLASKNGDLQFEGSITDYRVTSIAIQGNETAALNRLTITVKVKFTNTKDEKLSYESSFTRYSDYNSSQNLSTIEDALIEDINDQLTQDIFNKAVSNW